MPQAVVSSRILVLKDRAINLAAATEIVLPIASEVRRVRVLRVKLKYVSGSAVNFTPRIGSETGFSASSYEQEWLGGATAVADLFDTTGIDAWCATDPSGQLYLTITPDVGADNVFDYLVALEVTM